MANFWTLNRIAAACCMIAFVVSGAATVATAFYLLSAVAMNASPAAAWVIAVWFARACIIALSSGFFVVLLMSRPPAQVAR